MIHQLHAAWRARRVLLIGSTDRTTLYMQALLRELGARSALLAPGFQPETLHRALTKGRVSAVIVPCMRLFAQGSITEQLAALIALMTEVREAGIPLVILMSDENIYRAEGHPWHAQENDPIGGETPDGLIQSILDLYACGVSRGLCGDPVSVQIVRHLPCLGCGHPAAEQYSTWCRAASDECIQVHHPSATGSFVYPLDICCGVLLLGARFLLGDTGCTGAFNLGASSENLIPNRTAALRLIRRLGVKRSIRESEPPQTDPLPLPDGTKARLLCGARCRISGEDALLRLFETEQAALNGAESELREIEQQTRAYLRIIAAQ